MNTLLLASITEHFLMAALESATIQRILQAEGRTEMNAEEKARLRKATDQAQASAAAAVAQL